MDYEQPLDYEQSLDYEHPPDYEESLAGEELYFPSLDSQFADTRSAAKEHKRSLQKRYPRAKTRSRRRGPRCCQICNPPRQNTRVWRALEARVYAEKIESRDDDAWEVDTVYWEMGWDYVPPEDEWWRGLRTQALGDFVFSGEEADGAGKKAWVNDWVAVQRAREDVSDAETDEWSVVSGDDDYAFV